MNRARIEEIVSEFTAKRVLVIGDLMLDHYLWGSATRISPEAPVPVVEVESESFRPGGAANVIHNLHHLGAEVAAVGVVGDDVDGARLRELLAAEHVDLSGVITGSERPTTSKMRIIARHQHIVRADREVRAEVTGLAHQRLVACVCDAQPVDALFVSDYAKGVVTSDVMDAVRDAMRRFDCPVVVDPKERNFEKYRKATCISPNQAEAFAALYLDCVDEQGVVDVGLNLLRRFEFQTVLMTRGEKGVTLFERDGTVTHVPAAAREVFDVSGAGDTTAAVYTLSILAGASPQEAAYLGNLAGGVVVGKVGVATISVDELLKAAEP